MALTSAELALIAAPKVKNTKTNALVRIYNEDGTSTLERQMVKPSAFGKFVGKTGTKKRGRKGNVSTLPNGFVRYENPAISGSVEVVSYVA